jgi:Uma2 family endonuclease
LTIEDFERLPAEMAEGHELVDGELIDVSGNTLQNNSIRDLLIELLRPFVRERGLGTVIGEQEYEFDGNAHGPDVSFFGVEKQPLSDPRRRVQGFVPDLAIEVVSPNDTFQALVGKKERYRRCGTREVWIISPASREVYVYSERGDRILREDAELSTPLIPGFQITVKTLFETM